MTAACATGAVDAARPDVHGRAVDKHSGGFHADLVVAVRGQARVEDDAALGPGNSVRRGRVPDPLDRLALEGLDAGVQHAVVAGARLDDDGILDRAGVEVAGSADIDDCGGIAGERPVGRSSRGAPIFEFRSNRGHVVHDVTRAVLEDGRMRDSASKPVPSPFSSWLRADHELLSGSLETPFSGVAAYPIDRVPDELSAVKYRWKVVESLSTCGSRWPPWSNDAGLPSGKSAPPSGAETETFVQLVPSGEVASPSRGLKSLPRVPQ